VNDVPKIDALLDEANRHYHRATTLREHSPELALDEENMSRLALTRLALSVHLETLQERSTARTRR